MKFYLWDPEIVFKSCFRGRWTVYVEPGKFLLKNKQNVMRFFMTSILVKPVYSDLWYSQTYLLLIFMEIPGLRGYTQGTIYMGEKREINVS